jgi:hypothetical protein
MNPKMPHDRELSDIPGGMELAPPNIKGVMMYLGVSYLLEAR